MNYILIIGVFEGLFLVMLLLTKKKRTISDLILTMFFLVFSVNIGLTFIEQYNRTHGFPYPAFILTPAPFLLLHGPILWLYIKSLTDQYFRLKPDYLLHLIPFTAMIIQHTFEFYILPASEKIRLVLNEEFREYLSYYIFVTAISLSPIIYFYFGLKMIKRYKLKIEGYFSQTSEIDLKWLKVIIGSWLIVHCFINAFFVADLFVRIAPFGVMQFFSFVLGAVYIIFIGFYGLKQENVFLSKSINYDLGKITYPDTQEKFPEESVSPEKEFIHKLLIFMNEKKPFLEPEITIKNLSDQLNVSVEYLSDIINTSLNKNFFDFINHFRVEEFKTLCKDEKNRNLTIIGIAFNSGFNSKAAFYRAFRKNVGMSPTAYMERVSQ